MIGTIAIILIVGLVCLHLAIESWRNWRGR